MEKSRQALIYVASSTVDEPLCDDLLRHLSLLCRTQDVEIWCDRKVVPGRERDAEIVAHLELATLILLLVSPDLWDVPQVWEQVFDPAMARHRAGESVVVPIRLRPADWQGAPFAKLEPLPKGNKAVSELKQDRAFADLVNGIRDILEGLGTLNEDSYGGVVVGKVDAHEFITFL